MAEKHADELQPMPDWPALRERLWRTAYALTGSASDADDLTQQTLASLLAKVPDCTDRTAYARRTLIRLWLDERRSISRRLRRVARWSLTRPRWYLDRDRAPDSEQYERVRRVIEALPPRQRAVVVLRLIEELDYSEIATVLDCPIQAVRANLHLARGKARRALGKET